VYGFHNWPTDTVGHAYIKSGAVMAEIVQIEIKIFGKGGHGSEPSKCHDPIQPAIDIYNYTRDLIKSYEERKLNFRLTLPHIEAGSACNVIPDTSFIEGTFRSLDEKVTEEFIKSFSEKVDELCEKYSCKNEKKIKSLYPPLINSEKETECVLKLGKEFFGEDKISDNLLPFYASEDFAYYMKEKPGVFFFICSARNENDGYLHTENFNFNDDLLPIAANFWIKIAEERLGLDKQIFNIKSLGDLTVEEEEENKKDKITNSSKKIKKKRSK